MDNSKRTNPYLAFLGVVLTCAISSYYSYRSAKVQAESTSAVGYATLAVSHKALADAVEQHIREDERYTTELQAEIRLVRELLVTRQPAARPAAPVRPAPRPTPVAPVGMMNGAAAPHMFQQYQQTRIPDSLDGAVRAASKK